jgi:hypothetical protein
MVDRKQVFVAYPSRDQTLSDTVFEAVSKANALPLPIVYEPWRFNDVAGAPLISPILEKIDESPFVVADITYLNLNVVYEIGFAIGRSKRLRDEHISRLCVWNPFAVDDADGAGILQKRMAV